MCQWWVVGVVFVAVVIKMWHLLPCIIFANGVLVENDLLWKRANKHAIAVMLLLHRVNENQRGYDNVGMRKNAHEENVVINKLVDFCELRMVKKLLWCSFRQFKDNMPTTFVSVNSRGCAEVSQVVIVASLIIENIFQ